eukprot:TRINITY_DN8256_c0_g1_i5.p1 TRINITY_DN8256_c0_g1~~TRINITY_DN8256_c0_g1_i5.p1  ORF type:complete len:254 (-),score=48.81 TRINITY_DN8256_c0_g1_i5:749-1510(-)
MVPLSYIVDCEREVQFVAEAVMDILVRYSEGERAETDLCRSGSCHLVRRIFSHHFPQQSVLVEKLIEFVAANCTKPKCQLEILHTRLFNTLIEEALPNCTQPFCLRALEAIKAMVQLPEAQDRMEHSIQTAPLTELISYQKSHELLVSVLELILVLCKGRRPMIESIAKTDNGIAKISSISTISPKLMKLSVDIFSLFVSEFPHFGHLIADLPFEFFDCLDYKKNMELAVKMQVLLKHMYKEAEVLRTVKILL